MFFLSSFNSLQSRVEYEDSCGGNGASRGVAEDACFGFASELPSDSCDNVNGATVVEADSEDAVVVVMSDLARVVSVCGLSRGEMSRLDASLRVERGRNGVIREGCTLVPLFFS